VGGPPALTLEPRVVDIDRACPDAYARSVTNKSLWRGIGWVIRSGHLADAAVMSWRVVMKGAPQSLGHDRIGAPITSARPGFLEALALLAT
jgi:hypothetical protein